MSWLIKLFKRLLGYKEVGNYSPLPVPDEHVIELPVEVKPDVMELIIPSETISLDDINKVLEEDFKEEMGIADTPAPEKPKKKRAPRKKKVVKE